MVVIVPERMGAQRMEALENANRIRSKRSHLKRDIRAGRRSAGCVLAAPPEWVQTMSVMELLLAVPKWGRVKVNKVLASQRISPSKTLGDMSERQRMALAAVLLGARR